jgi:hypothetical protein
MKQQLDWLAREPTKYTSFMLQAEAAVVAGRLRESRLLSRRALAWAKENKRPVSAAEFAMEAALFHALVG